MDFSRINSSGDLNYKDLHSVLIHRMGSAFASIKERSVNSGIRVCKKVIMGSLKRETTWIYRIR